MRNSPNPIEIAAPALEAEVRDNTMSTDGFAPIEALCSTLFDFRDCVVKNPSKPAFVELTQEREGGASTVFKDESGGLVK